MKKIVIVGPPGCGKGTQSKILSERLNLNHISSGDMIREIMNSINKKEEADRTSKEKELICCMNEGRLVDDALICHLIMEKLEIFSGFILDGFPRNQHQAKLVLDHIDLVIFINVDYNECINRITSRNEGRSDDTKEVAQNRLEIYRKETLPAIEFLRGIKKFVEVDGNQLRLSVADDIYKIFD